MAQSKLTILEVINQTNTPDGWGKHLYPKELLNLIGFASAGVGDYFEKTKQNKKKGYYLAACIIFW